MTNKVTTLLPLAIVGLSSRAQSRLRSFLLEIADDLCQVVEVQKAQAFVADIDGDESVWMEFRARYRNFPTIVLSRQRPDLDDVIWVPKPIMEVALIEAIHWAINHAKESANDTMAGSRHGADMVFSPALATGRRDKDSTLKIYNFKDSETVLALFRAACERAVDVSRPVSLKFKEGGELLILPRDGLVAVSVQSTLLMELAHQEQVQGLVTVHGLSVAEERAAMTRLESYSDVEPVTAMSWKLAVWTARGQLPTNTDPYARYYLRCWPNFTRLLVIPHAIRIASLWVREPMSLIFISEQLEIAPADVFTFYYAAKSIGLAGAAKREDDYLFANQTATGDGASGARRAVTHIGRDMS